MAQHRGSLLGSLPEKPQPSQKMFDSRLWDALHHLDPQLPVFVEAESRKIGSIALPSSLLQAMRASTCVVIEAPLEARIKLLMEDYGHFLHDPDLLTQRLAPLVELHGHRVIENWNSMADQGDWHSLAEALLTQHYDPAYRRSTAANFLRLKDALVMRPEMLDDEHLRIAAASAITGAV
jgi:tRNA 2-selenouridine synthase